MAEQKLLDDFKNKPEDRWKFISDTVMGGISSGRLSFSADDDANFARMVGKVSTENNGGFIQFRRSVINGLPTNTKGLKLSSRGNGQKYFVHIRTKGTFLPWQYYQQSFMANEDWSEKALDYCEGSGYPVEHILTEMMNLGLSKTDIVSLERLDDPKVLNQLPESERNLQKNKKEDVVTYMEAWAQLLEKQLPSEAPEPEPQDAVLNVDTLVGAA